MSEVIDLSPKNLHKEVFFYLYDVMFPANYPNFKTPSHTFVPTEAELSAKLERREDTRNLQHFVVFRFAEPSEGEDATTFQFKYDPKTSRVYIDREVLEATLFNQYLHTSQRENETPNKKLSILHDFLQDCVRTVHLFFTPEIPARHIRINCVISDNDFSESQVNEKENSKSENSTDKPKDLFGWEQE